MQNEITSKQPLFNEKGVLANPGWARKMYFQYDPNAMAAPRNTIREWDYYFVGSRDFGISMTINHFGPASMLTGKVLNFKDQYHLSNTRMFIGDICQPYDDEDTCYIRCDDAEGMFIRKPGKHYLKLSFPNYHEGKTLKFDITLTVPETDRMVIATPFAEGEHMFFFNEKLNNMRASGTVELGDFRRTFTPERDFAVLDFGRGSWPVDNRWYWASGNGELNGHDFGFNLGYGFGDLSNATENMLFYDGVAHKFDRITFEIPEGGHMAGAWRIASNDGRFDTVFTPIYDRYQPSDLKKVGSRQHQVFGLYNGTCTLDDGTVLELKDYFGFAEDVINYWPVL